MIFSLQSGFEIHLLCSSIGTQPVKSVDSSRLKLQCVAFIVEIGYRSSFRPAEKESRLTLQRVRGASSLWGPHRLTVSRPRIEMGSMQSWLKRYEIDALGTGPFTPPFACSLAPLTQSLAPHCSLRSRAPLRSFVRSLAHSLTPELMGKRFLSSN